MFTGAELQKRYRENQKIRGYHRISAWISPQAAAALSHIAQHYNVTKQDVLERLLINEHDKLLSFGKKKE